MWLMGVGIVLLVLLPVWFPWVLTPTASRYGIRFAHYERIGWNRFALTGVHGEWGGTRLDAQRVESVLPTTWLWRRFNNNTNSPPLLRLSDGRLLIGGAATNAITTANRAPQGSMGETLNQISRIGHTLQRILPVADLTNCIVEFASTRLSIPHADWRAGRLHGAVRIPASRGQVELAVQLNGDSAIKFAADWGDYDAALHGEFLRAATGWRWNGELEWRTNRAEFTAQFTTNGWWPAQAQVVCPDWQIPAGVEGYENLNASLTANLVSNRFDLQATGFAQPEQTGWPVVNFSLGAAGDPTGVKLHTLTIQSPWLNADLTNTVGITWTGELRAEPAQLHVAVDFGKLPGAGLTGLAEGAVQILPQRGQPPVAHFRFSAGEVHAQQLDAKTILVRGEYAANILKLTEGRADFSDGTVVTATGAFDGKTRRIMAGRWELSGDLLQRLLPGLCYAGLTAAGELAGPLTNLTHRGELTVTGLQVAGLKPVHVHATWSGQQQYLAAAEVECTAGESVLSIGGGADLGVVVLNRLSLRRGVAELYALQQPVALSFGAGGTLAVDAFDWRNERHSLAGMADIAWPARGAVTVTMTNVAFADFADFLEADIPNIVVAELAATAHWSNGPVHSVISAAGSLSNRTGQVVSLRGAVTTDEFLKIDLSALAGGSTSALSMTGTIPVKVMPARDAGMLVWDKSQTIAVAGNWTAEPTKKFSIPLGTGDQLDVSRPVLSFQVAGTPAEPTASLTVAATELAWLSKTNQASYPKLADLQLAVEIQPDAIRLKTFTAKVDGQPVVATGEWPFPADAWRTGQRPDWNEAQGHLEVADAQVAALAAYLPAVLAPEGRLSVTVDLKAGKHLTGMLSLTNAATRPMGTITPLRDIAAVVRFDGTRAVLEEFQAQIGGQPVRADGFVTIPELAGSGLDYQVNITGTNVPLARSSELLLRGDVAVKLSGGSNQPPVLSGAITLRDGLYVQNASALVWSTPHRPELRPPYFSVTNAPFADWRLDLTVSGDRFLRLRTPVFSGIASADLQLKGALRAPILTGDARVNSGRLIFPFGSLTVNQGLVSFSGNDPQGPDVQFNAGARNYGYDLRLEVKGPADGANVTFASTPPLVSEQILLMLTAGELPQSEFAFSNAARAGRLATFLGQDLLGRFLGSDPAKERLIIRTGEGISAEGRLTYSVEYRLNEQWSIIGEYDEFNAFNTDLKWKVFSQ